MNSSELKKYICTRKCRRRCTLIVDRDALDIDPYYCPFNFDRAEWKETTSSGENY